MMVLGKDTLASHRSQRPLSRWMRTAARRTKKSKPPRKTGQPIKHREVQALAVMVELAVLAGPAVFRYMAVPVELAVLSNMAALAKCRRLSACGMRQEDAFASALGLSAFSCAPRPMR